MSLWNKIVARLLGYVIDSVTVWDRFWGIPIAEASEEPQLAISEDRELLVRVTPPEEYHARVFEEVKTRSEKLGEGREIEAFYPGDLDRWSDNAHARPCPSCKHLRTRLFALEDSDEEPICAQCFANWLNEVGATINLPDDV